VRLWVHRLSVSEGGDPAAAVDELTFDLHRVLREIRKTPLAINDDRSGARECLVSELIEHGRMRQGWGVPGLDLRKRAFHDNFVIAIRKYWNAIPQSTIDALEARDAWDDGELFGILESAYREAEGRHRILRRMQEMSRGDVVFLPNIPHDGSTFTVARIADAGYEFRERNPGDRGRMMWEFDFGHVRTVRDVRTYPYGAETLRASMFGTPYRHAVDKVSARAEALESFLRISNAL